MREERRWSPAARLGVGLPLHVELGVPQWCVPVRDARTIKHRTLAEDLLPGEVSMAHAEEQRPKA